MYVIITYVTYVIILFAVGLKRHFLSHAMTT